MLHRWFHRVRNVASPGASGQGLALIIVVAVVTIAALLILGVSIVTVLHTVVSQCPFGPCH